MNNYCRPDHRLDRLDRHSESCGDYRVSRVEYLQATGH